MAPVTNADGPVAVTGAAGYIGGHVVKNLVEHGYTVRACVRDASRLDKTEFLTAMNGKGSGKVELWEADMLKNGVYDDVFKGCSSIFHIAANLGHDPTYGNPWSNPMTMYNGLVNGTRNVLNSIEKSGSVKRLIYTSSGAAVKGPHPTGYVFSEADWCGAGGPENMQKKWNGHFTNERNPYGKGKMDCELLCYAWGNKMGIDVITCIPEHTIGPLLCKAHNSGWQNSIGQIFCGRYNVDQLWGVTDVRDCAEGYRLMAESTVAKNGSRYFIITPPEVGGAPTPKDLIAALQELYPNVEGIGGSKPLPERPGQFLPVKTDLAQRELGLRCHHIMDTLKDNIESLVKFGCIQEIRDHMAKRAVEKAKSKL